MQKYYLGQNSISNLSQILSELSPTCIFLVTGKKSFEISGAKERIVKILGHYNYTHFSDFSENPQYEDVIKGTNIFLQKPHDILIAIGGGSVIDMAKLINVSVSFGIDNALQKSIPDNIKLKPLIAIPTTAGSGSEATHFAVIYKNGIKYSIANSNIQPKIAIIDSTFTYNSPQFLSACSAFDALSQAIESYWNRYHTEESTQYSIKAITLIWNNILKGVLENDKTAKDAISEGAYWAGRAINITKTTAAHALSYSLTVHYNIPHGQAVSVFFPEVFRFNISSIIKNEKDTSSLERINSLLTLLCVRNYKEAYLNIKKCINTLGLTLSKKHIIDLNQIVEETNVERLNNNPIILSKKNIEHIVEQALHNN